MLPLPVLLAVVSIPPVIAETAPPALQPEIARRLVDPPRCIAARCLQGEWQVAATAQIPAGQVRIGGTRLPGAGSQLTIPGSRRDWVKAQGSNARLGLQFGAQMLKTGESSLSLAMETGYRLQGYADDGIAGTGPVWRGQLEWSHELDERLRLSQTARLEAGQHGLYLRNNLSVDIRLHPQWRLGAGVETRHDSDVSSRNQTDATVKLRYLF